ncbi:hypothetical protein AB7Y64_13340, partial [Providencia rettgeri]
MKKLNIIALALATCTMTFGASAAIGSGQSQPFDPNEPSICSGQLKLATVLEFFRYWFSDSFGGNP